MPVSARHHHELSWPQIRGPVHQVACHFCDTLQATPRLGEGEGAFCTCCGKMLFINQPHSLARATSFSSAALILMGVTHTFPMLTMSAGGEGTRLTLWEASQVLAQENRPLLAVAVIFFTMIAPVILMSGLLYVAEPLRRGHTLPGTVTMMRWFQGVEPWSMMEVFLLGLIVSLLKLRNLADVHYGVGLWALGALVLCMAAALGSVDKLELWDRIEVVHHYRERAAHS